MNAAAGGAGQADIAIIGAGAAGLAAGIFAAGLAPDASFRIVALEGARKIGAKILVSGGGRCNVTHDTIAPGDFHGPRHLIRNILAAFPVEATRAWFTSLGVELKAEEGGKLFPVSDKAGTVLDALIGQCRQMGVELCTGCRVHDILPTEGPRFRIVHGGGELTARRVIMATGGKSLPRTGSDGQGWAIVRRLGHRVTAVHPALVPLVLAPDMFHAGLAGISQDVELTMYVEKHAVDRRRGSLLWTHFGISGPVVMDASRFWTIARAKGREVELRCNFWPNVGPAEAEPLLLARIGSRPRLSLANLLAQDLPDRVAEALCRHSGIEPSLPCGQLTREQRRAVIACLRECVLPVTGDRGWNFAEVTAGGVPLAEVNFRTMESRLCPGLYLVGEMLDCDGRIGGFNFQWAWATGHVAGRAAARSLLESR